jgi:hypothetical protein
VSVVKKRKRSEGNLGAFEELIELDTSSESGGKTPSVIYH